MSTCGTFFVFRYFQMERFGAVPRLPKSAKMPSCSTSSCVRGTVFDGSYASSLTLKSIFRPLTPPCALTYAKYAPSAAGIVLYSDATPVSGNVPPILIVVDVTPGSARCAPDAAVAATDTTNATAATATRLLSFALLRPPYLQCWPEPDIAPGTGL